MLNSGVVLLCSSAGLASAGLAYPAFAQGINHAPYLVGNIIIVV
jgi:hypothetical protein